MLKIPFKPQSNAVHAAFPANGSARTWPASTRLGATTLLAALSVTTAQAIGLGQVNVQSALGQPLRATISLLGDDGTRTLGTCFNARLSSADGAFIVVPRIALTPGATSATLTLSTSIPIAEPALSLLVEMGCGDGIRREFSLLLDPPMNPANIPVPVLDQYGNIRTGPTPARERVPPMTATAEPAPPVARQRSKAPTPVEPPAAPKARQTVAKSANPAGRNVLRLASSDGSDVDMMNAIGLRLARANSLAERTAPADKSAIPDLAEAAAARAAQARFAALLRDDGKTDAGPAVTEQRLQELQKKMLALETETLRLKQASQRDAVSLSAARLSAQNESLGSTWIVILGALLALCAGAVVWLLIRVKHLKQHNMTWNWEENVAAAGHDEATQDARGPEQPLFAEQVPRRDGLGAAQHAPAHAARTHSAPASVPLEFTPIDAVLPVPKNQHAVDKGGSVATTRSSAPAASAPQNPAETATAQPTVGQHDDLQFDEIKLDAPAVEEISDVMQEAEFWISLHDSQRAIEVLQPYATLDHPTSPLPWLYLFELHADLGHREQYNILHERFQRAFNGKVPSWAELEQNPPPTYLRGIEDVPHIAEKIMALWPTDQIVPYLESLLIDDRDGNRVGFDLPVYREIMFLIGIAYELQSSRKFIKPSLGSPDWTIAA